MADTELLIVGPASARTGGVSRYISQQHAQLSGDVATTLHDTTAGIPDGPLSIPAAIVRTLGTMLAFLSRPPSDVVHVHTSHHASFFRNAFYVLFAAYVWRRPVVLHVHGSSFDTFVADASPPVAVLQSLVFGACTEVIVLSEYWRDVLASRTDPEKLTVLPNAVSVDRYDPTFGRERPHLVFLSNHIERKGVREFVEAVDRVLSDGRDVDVTIAGAGPLSHLAEALADEREAVTYVGYVDEAEKRRLLSDATIYALPTHAEGLPIAILEAMAGGAAVVSTTVGSIPEVVDESNGRVVAPGDVDALAAALDELLADPGAVREMGERNRELAVDRYSWTRTTRRLRTIYDRSRADRPGP